MSPELVKVTYKGSTSRVGPDGQKWESSGLPERRVRFYHVHFPDTPLGRMLRRKAEKAVKLLANDSDFELERVTPAQAKQWYEDHPKPLPSVRLLRGEAGLDERKRHYQRHVPASLDAAEYPGGVDPLADDEDEPFDLATIPTTLPRDEPTLTKPEAEAEAEPVPAATIQAQAELETLDRAELMTRLDAQGVDYDRRWGKKRLIEALTPE